MPIHIQHALQPLHHKEVGGYALFFALVYFVQGAIDLTSGLANQPVQYLLKENMGLTAAQSGFFFAVIGLGWTIKPLYGLLSDFLPLAGYQRKGYLLLMSTLGIGSWLALSMSSLNVGRTGANFLGGWLYDHLGLVPLILLSAGFTAMCWLIVLFLRSNDYAQAVEPL